MQGTEIRSLVQEDSTCDRADKPMDHSYWAGATTAEARLPGDHALQQEKPLQWEAQALSTKNNPLLTTAREKLGQQWRPSIAKKNFF